MGERDIMGAGMVVTVGVNIPKSCFSTQFEYRNRFKLIFI